jgi:FlaA1/EpsC-like NDP-sugar epimerase
MHKGKRILVSGGAGSIGSELVRQLCQKNKVYILDINESGIFDLVEELKPLWVVGRVGNIQDMETVKDVFDDFRPQIVFNCAARKHVPLMEYTPLEAIQTNVIGHYNLIHTAKTWECVEKFIFVSSDKSVNGNSIMGITKKMGEVMTTNQGKGYLSVRFGNVLGSRGSLMTIWQRQINSGESITVTHPDMERYFMTIEDAVKLVIKASEIGDGGEIFCLDMGKKVNVLELAKRLTEELKFGNIKINGIRPGETLTENLMTFEETNRAIKKEEFWIIPKYENETADKRVSKKMETK